MNPSSGRVDEIKWLLATALDSEDEYIHDGEMCFYPRRYADDAASDLDLMFRTRPPDDAEIALVLEMILEPERIHRGASMELLIALRDRSHPILRALTAHRDAKVRLFGLDACKASLPGLHYRPLYGTIDIVTGLLNDPDETVRLAAIEAGGETLARNSEYLAVQMERTHDAPIVGLYNAIRRLLDDPSASVSDAALAAIAKSGVYRGGSDQVRN